MSELRAVIDTNVVVSGLQERFSWVSSEPLIHELGRVMRSKKFSLSQAEIEDLLGPVLAVLEIVVPSREVRAIERCPADNRVLEAALEGKARAIVTGDRRDLLSLVHFERIPILSVRAFLDLL